MMSTKTYLRVNRLLFALGRVIRKHGLLVLSQRYTPKRAEILLEREARLRRWLLELIDEESRRAA